MAEQRIDGTDLAGITILALGGLFGPTDNRIDGADPLNAIGAGIAVTTYTMRGFSASLSQYATWTATIMDPTASQYAGAGTPLTDIVCLKTQ